MASFGQSHGTISDTSNVGGKFGSFSKIVRNSSQNIALLNDLGASKPLIRPTIHLRLRDGTKTSEVRSAARAERHLPAET